MIVPDTDVYLIKCPLEINDINQLTFANATSQYNYFQSLPKMKVENYTYQRKDGVIRIGELIDDIQSYNYIMYRNTNHSSKWFYAFITGMEYLNDNVTAVSIKTDVWQTWQFDLSYKRTFIEREHVNDDTIGKHTIPEGLETGEYVTTGLIDEIIPYKDSWPEGADRSDPTKKIRPRYMITFQVTEIQPILSMIPDSTYMILNGCFSGTYVFGCQWEQDARNVIRIYDAAGKAESIVSIFLAPVPFFDHGIQASGSVGGISVSSVIIPQANAANTKIIDGTYYAMPTTLDGYTPKNNKCYTYPFSFINVDNHNGGMVTFRYEDFAIPNGETKPKPCFTMEGALSQGCAVELLPRYYKNDSGDNYTYGVVGAKFPQCSWKSDYYTNWCTQNALSYPFGVAKNVAGGLLSMATGAAFGGPLGLIGGVVNLLSGVGNSVSQKYEAEIHPDQIKGQQSNGDLLIGGNSGSYIYFTLYRMCAKAEYLKQADSFFDMFGYKVNEVKVPNITGRRNWNYVKTIGCYIEADIPQEDLQEIKSMFDKGITFWHNPVTFMDYSQNNDII